MPDATVTTEEKFPAGRTEAQLKEEQRLRIKAGAIRSNYTGSEAEGWTLTTEWNLIGQQ